MTDDEDRTQEIRRDGPPPSVPRAASGDTAQYARRPTGNTPPFGMPAGAPQPQAGYQRPVPGYAPAPPSGIPASGRPMLPVDRGSSGFPAAILGAVVAALLAVASSYANYQAVLHNVSRNPGTLKGYLLGLLGTLPWPAGSSGKYLTALLAGVVIILVVSLVLIMAATMSTRAGNGGFAVFLAGWLAVVIGGGIAGVAAVEIWSTGPTMPGAAGTFANSGLVWGAWVGWIPGLVVLAAHAMRRKPVSS
ncbi:hypothetical protein [Flexivirga caeni]|uniref:Uncharacterized protein n=1 Tax=Flexivirga caeni TaxID=2294115 RepID=A0A3M9M761_9MICO|nr:hypothetical protein [Flexivirga caeni]RNI21400.1 hypothetical protein EFY87_12075 [Flexivirga caeni]